MDRRRRSHRTEHRAEALADLLRQALRSYGQTIELHDGCPSCGTDLAILQDRAAELGVDFDPE